MTDKQILIYDDMSRKIIDATLELVTELGHQKVTVRSILRKLHITNRVFYNRFHNVEEVFNILYEQTLMKIRECVSCQIDPEKDFFEQVTDMVANTLNISYDHKKRFNNYFFQSDSLSAENFVWWQNEIKRLIEYAYDRGLIIEVDAAGISYAIWCFCRGYNADAVSRDMPKDEAIRNFKYCFGFLLDGIRKR